MTSVCISVPLLKKLPEDVLLSSFLLEFFGIQHNIFYALQNIDMETEEIHDIVLDLSALVKCSFNSLMTWKRDQLCEMCQIWNIRFNSNKTELAY